MKKYITATKGKLGIRGGICFAMALILCCPFSAKAAPYHPQNIIDPTAQTSSGGEFTSPYRDSWDSKNYYWGIYFQKEDDPEIPESYTVDSSIKYEELSLDENNIYLYGIQNEFSGMLLNVSKHIQITASGLNKPTTSGFINLVGIESVGSITTSSDASMTIIGKGGGALNTEALEKTTTVPDVRASVVGIQTTGDGALLTVHGDVTVEAHGGRTQAEAMGSTIAQATGILHKGNSGEIENTGSLNIIARGGTNTKSNADVTAYGIKSNASGVRITNRGNITVEGQGGTTTSTKTYARAGSTAYGISGAGEVVNYGGISVYAKAGTGIDSGINATGVSGENVTNHGKVTVESLGGTSTGSKQNNVTYGVYSKKSLTNEGDVTVTATGGTYVASGKTLPATVFASGLRSGTDNFHNTGNISVVVNGASCNTISSPPSNYTMGYGLETSAATITNTGTIDVRVTGGAINTDSGGSPLTARAYGMYIKKDATLYSSGLINVFSQMNPSITASIAPEDQAHAAYQIVTGANLRITGYAMEIGNTQDEFNRMYQGTVYSTPGNTVTFDNTELVVHMADDYKDGLYDIPRLWKQETAEQKAATPNQFASLASINVPPGVDVELFSGTLSTPQRIGLNYVPKVSTPLKQALISMKLEDNIHAIIHENLTSQMLFNVLSDTSQQPNDTLDSHGVSSASTTMVASLSSPNILPVLTAKQPTRHSVFMRPVYVNSSDSASSGYNSNTYGFVFGYNYNVNEELNDTYLGFHAGYTRGDIRYTGEDYGDRKEFVDTFYGGLHGITRLKNNFLLSGEASFFYVDSDMTDDNPTNRETARYDSVSIRAEADLGYLWMIGGHTIIPEIGLEYVWQHRDPFTTNNMDSADTTYGTMDNNELYGTARLKWTKTFVADGNCRIIPLIGVGITQILTDGEISNSMQLGNETQLVIDQDENTTFTPEANITITKDNYYAIAGYNGGFGGTTKSNMFWLQLGVNF
ncbi:autotransporter outer membrane beta-barrel domain-containing protein [Halodesulfovibrio sp. MK-HDV]|uniref:autotransporter outer membrane beta-barrel domain-containing protein n=1 Tax=Halodesulfovibrio sp. MK-HDV TaxID=2599925 RepID=UPI00136CCDC0|nr:autotransporter outer membrane beta-barrel domain-containing protein [Halodesulfovibrio sp. MK-HDV]KAF1074788.1 hypothetical protein MKHDV_02582 [Halodesulfovibrio sp. MK-HDV]